MCSVCPAGRGPETNTQCSAGIAVWVSFSALCRVKQLCFKKPQTGPIASVSPVRPAIGAVDAIEPGAPQGLEACIRPCACSSV